MTSGQLSTTLTGNEDITHEGSFFGVGYDEVGAAFLVDGQTEGSLQIYGTYLGD